MKIILKHHTPLYIAADAIRTCWQSQENSDTVHEKGHIYQANSKGGAAYRLPYGSCGEADRAIIDRVGNKFKHASTLEHLSYNFEIDGISRACLQELARHRMASLSVKSTRYTLKELKEEEPFTVFEDRSDSSRIAKYIVLTDVEMVDDMSVRALENLRAVLSEGISNDRAKYCLPESYKTSLAWTINARSLQNFLSLRSDKAALWEIRNLAGAIYAALPAEHRYLFEDHLKKETL